MKKCLIITSYIEGSLSEIIGDEAFDFILCADGGWDHALQAGLTPDLLIGDFDSMKGCAPSDIEIITFPAEKDDTDTGLCLKTAISRGCTDILIAGGLGGRFDHSVANIQLMLGVVDLVDHIAIKNGRNYCTVLKNGEIQLQKKEGFHLSVFSMTEQSRGVCLSGVKYLLSDYTLTGTFPLGVSNEFADDYATVRVGDGTLLIVLSSD